MSELNTYYKNSITSSVINKGAIDVEAHILPKTTTQWTDQVKGKVWKNENGFIIENGSYVAYGKSVREFYVYRNQGAFDRGVYFDSAPNLITAKIKAENFKREKE
jgi:hypothetical protein